MAKQARKPVSRPTTDAAPRAQVEAALAGKDGAQALTAALAWWTATRAPAVADLVDAISARVSAAPIVDTNDFVRIARDKDPLDLGGLLAAIPELAASFLPTAGQLLAGFPEDPRLARAVASWALDPITTSSSTYPFWTHMLDAMARARDVRVVAALQSRLRKLPGDSKFWPKFYAALTRAIGKLGDPPPDVAVPAALAKRVATLSPIAAHAPAAEVVAAAAHAPAPAGSLLDQAGQHLAAGRVVAAITAMVERWRATRDPGLADAIDRATRLLPSYDLPVVEPATAGADPWMAIFERDPYAAMPQLLQAINVYDGRYGAKKLADRRLMELANLPDDPRIALRLAELCTIFGVSPQRTQYWKSVFEQLARIRDARTCAPLRLAFRDFTGKYFDHHRQAKRIVGAFAMQEPPVAALPAVDRAALAALAAAIELAEAKSLPRMLVAAIAAAWDDDTPRLVYADWLSEHGHPRGEAIALACKRDRSQPETEGRREPQGCAYVYGALEDVSAIGHDACDRGIPTRLVATWSTGTLSWRALAGHPLVALIETIDVGAIQQPPTAADLVAVVRAATRLRAIERVEEDAEHVLWAFADEALPGFRRTDGRFVRS